MSISTKCARIISWAEKFISRFIYVYQNTYQDDVLYLNIDLIFKTVIKGYIIFNWHIIYNTYQVDKKLVGCEKISPLDSKAQYQVVTEIMKIYLPAYIEVKASPAITRYLAPIIYNLVLVWDIKSWKICWFQNFEYQYHCILLYSYAY